MSATTISKITTSTPQAGSSKTWDKCRDFASVVCSRESTYRTLLDVTAFDIPLLLSDLPRGFKKVCESLLEASASSLTVIAEPFINTFVGGVVSKWILPKGEQENTLNYLRFSMGELRTAEGIKEGLERIKKEEPEDQNFVASLFRRQGKEKLAKHHEEKAEEIKQFCENTTIDEETRKKLYKLKKMTLIGGSMIEGGWWGGYGLLMRMFRKYVLHENRFTGTKNYLSDAESEARGESSDITTTEKAVGIGSVFLSPLMNTLLLNKVEDDKAVEKSKFLQTVKEQLDTTHGVYPKLGFLFTMTTIPKWTGVIALAQGNLERVERVLKLLTVIPSWWMGHRVTNGTYAKKADVELAKKYNVDKGILVEPEFYSENKNSDNAFVKLKNTFPEPARINHVMSRTEGNEELQMEAEDLHAKCLFKGFTLHSVGVFLVNLAVNQITKWRATS